MAKRDNLVIGLDIGTTKICCVVGESNHDGVDIIGIGSHTSTGLRKGVVVNIDRTVHSIKRAVEEAELMAGCEISDIYAGIAGGHIKGLNSHGVIAVKNREVSEGDIRRVVEAARAVAIPPDREVIHILPQEFLVDDQDGIKDPLGMNGVRLEAKVHIVTGAVTSAQNIIRCANRTGLNVNDIILEQLASSESVLTPDEKELGVALVDIGGGTTDIAVFCDGAIKYTTVLTLGGDHFTSDIALGMRTPLGEAEKIKQRFGCAMTDMVQDNETIEVASVGGRKPRTLPRKTLASIIEPRAEEILELIKHELRKSGHDDVLGAGVVLTGGCSLLEGFPELGEKILKMPVRRGFPQGIGGLTDLVSSPIYATGVGLILHGSKNGHSRGFRIRDDNIFARVRERMVSWFAEFF